MKIQNAVVSLYKFADDMALVGLLDREQAVLEQMYFDHIIELQEWCLSSSLQLNVGKTKELVVDMIKKPVNVLPSVIVNGEPVEIVDNFKYLGTHIDNKLTWQPQCEKQEQVR